MSRVIVLLVGLLAQVLGIEADASQWGELGVATLFVWGSVELLRKSVLPNVDGVQVHLLAGAVGAGIGIVFGLGEIVAGTVFDWLVFGIQATFYATLVDLGLKKAGGGSGNSLPQPAE